jgi:hypothetical protein
VVHLPSIYHDATRFLSSYALLKRERERKKEKKIKKEERERKRRVEEKEKKKKNRECTGRDRVRQIVGYWYRK